MTRNSVSLLYLLVCSFSIHFYSSYVFGEDVVDIFDIKIKLSHLLSEKEMLCVVKWLDTITGPGEPIKKLEDFIIPQDELKSLFFQKCDISLEKEYEFIKLNLLRGIAKKVTIVWYSEEGLLEEITKHVLEEKEFIYDEKREHRHEILDDESIKNARIALNSYIVRLSNSSTMVSGIGYGIHPFPPHGILFETDKEKFFIGITRFGFHLGSWKNNKIDQSKLFYWPELSLFLDDYIKKNKLQDFPQINLDVLSGKDAIQSQIEGYQYRKQKENNIKNDDGE
jgi:hypothetical protein